MGVRGDRTMEEREIRDLIQELQEATEAYLKAKDRYNTITFLVTSKLGSKGINVAVPPITHTQESQIQSAKTAGKEITVRGQKYKSLYEAVNKLTSISGISYGTAKKRLDAGHSPEASLLVPVGMGGDIEAMYEAMDATGQFEEEG